MEQGFQNPIDEEITSFEREALAKASEPGPDPYLTPEGADVVQLGKTLPLEFTSDRDGLVASVASAEHADRSFPIEYVHVMLNPAKLEQLRAYGVEVDRFITDDNSAVLPKPLWETDHLLSEIPNSLHTLEKMVSADRVENTCTLLGKIAQCYRGPN